MKYLIPAFFCVFLSLVMQRVDCGHGMREQYHEQGHHGHPKSYKFGYDTGDDHNPITRHEVSHGPGHVKGSYSYYDGHGHKHVVHYEAHPKYGFKRTDTKAHR